MYISYIVIRKKMEYSLNFFKCFTVCVPGASSTSSKSKICIYKMD